MKFFVYTFLLMAALVAFAFKVNDDIERITPSKNIVTKSLTVSSFDDLDISSSLSVKFVQSTGKPQVTVKAPDNLIDRVIVKTEGNKLVVRLQKNTSISNMWKGKNDLILVTITAPAPTEIDMSGATSFSADVLNVKKLEVDISGASVFKVGNLAATKCEFDVSGASDVKIDAANVADSDFDVSGASSAKVGNLSGTNTSVEIAGASKVNIVGTTGMLDLDVSGTSAALLGDFAAIKGKVDVSGMSTAKTRIGKITSRSVSGMSVLDNTYK